VREVPVERIRPEEGLGRKRYRDGHRELQRSIERFGVLTPITVRLAPDGSGEYLLIKGRAGRWRVAFWASRPSWPSS
jgi:ParB-like chromosome segregation protein Spo0J